MPHLFGAHTIHNGGIDMAVRRAAAAGQDALQVFTAIPKFYGDRSGVRPERAERFRAAVAESGIRSEHIVAHAAYVLSVATADQDKWHRATAGLTKELERCVTLGIGNVCFHPGSATDDDPHAGAARVAAAMVAALGQVEGPVRLLVENTAGAGRTVGRTAAEVGEILAQLPAAQRARAGYGLDTCHLYASGYAIHESPERLSAILDEFQDATGEPPAFLHLNDSQGELGSNRDRHALIGEGEIGQEPFGWLLADARSRGVPLILETPQQNPDIEGEDPTPDPWDVRMLELLRGLARG
ncbi:MAG: deoxyribonuclease IV [Gemmatimonadota bacterium]